MLLSVFIYLGSIGHGFASDWTLNKSINNVEFYYKIGECDGQDVIFLKIVNMNDFEIEATWTDMVYDRVLEMNTEAHYGSKELLVPAEATLQADCSEAESSDLIVLAQFIIPTHIGDVQSFDFKNITVNFSQ